MIAATHRVAQLNASIRAGSWDKRLGEQTSLFGNSIASSAWAPWVGSCFRCSRPSAAPCAFTIPICPRARWSAGLSRRNGGFEEAMRQPIVSVHASQTPETYLMIDANALELLPEGGILLNTARGSLVDTQVLIAALQTRRIYAVLDVYEEEGAGNQPEALLQCGKIRCCCRTSRQPPRPGNSRKPWWTISAASCAGEPLTLAVSLRQYRLMTQE